MPNVLVRDLPEDVHGALLRRAEAAGKSLQQYLMSELTRLATTPTLPEVLERITERAGGKVGFAEAVEDLSSERSRR